MKLKPFDFSHAEQLVGKAVKVKDYNVICLITEIDNVEVVIGNEKYYFNDLLSDFTFLDGTPCGIVENEDNYDLSFIEVLQIAKKGDKFIGNNTGYKFKFENNCLVYENNKFFLLQPELLNDKYKKL